MRLPGVRMSFKEFIAGLWTAFTRDGVIDLAASVTYYGILSLFPFLMVLVAAASVVITPAQAKGIVDQLSRVAPGPVAKILGDRIMQLGQQQNVAVLGFGLVFTLWSASGAMMALVGAMNRCYDVREGRPWWKVRGLSAVMTIVAWILAICGALAAVAAPPLASWIGGPVGTAIVWLRLPVSAVLMMLLWALLYYVLPDVQQTFRFISPGSVLGVLLWHVASWGFSRYVSSFARYDRVYGSLGGIIVLLVWMWISTLVLLVGAEVNALIEHRSPEGKRPGAKLRTDVGTEPISPLTPARGGPHLAPAPAVRGRPPVRGLLALATGLVAGILVARRGT